MRITSESKRKADAPDPDVTLQSLNDSVLMLEIVIGPV